MSSISHDNAKGRGYRFLVLGLWLTLVGAVNGWIYLRCAPQSPGKSAPAEEEDRRPLVCSQATVDFGVAHRPVEKISHTFIISNTALTKKRLRIARTSCGCTKATLRKSELEPGESTSLAVEWKPHDRLGVASFSVWLASDPSEEEPLLCCSGHVEVRDWFNVTPGTVDVARLRPGETRTVRIEVFPEEGQLLPHSGQLQLKCAEGGLELAGIRRAPEQFVFEATVRAGPNKSLMNKVVEVGYGPTWVSIPVTVEQLGRISATREVILVRKPKRGTVESVEIEDVQQFPIKIQSLAIDNSETLAVHCDQLTKSRVRLRLTVKNPPPKESPFLSGKIVAHLVGNPMPVVVRYIVVW